ncbi:MAG: DUF480 domain-containing protein [Planctomycetota bacterium]|nr:MAG: DUF480 domain-containing protein [Planctomycetota bacterium]
MSNELCLSPEEARVLGVLIEKSITTPDHYPLSLNALVNGCNQKSNRDPVLDLDAREVKKAARELGVKQLSVEIWPSTGSRIEKYRHVAEAGLGIGDKQLAVLGELLLRRTQMPGELRTRVSRMVQIESQAELKQILEELIDRKLVVRLAPSPGSRAERYDHLLCPSTQPETSAPAATAPVQNPAETAAASTDTAASASSPSQPPSSLDAIIQRIAALEARVAKLEKSARDH